MDKGEYFQTSETRVDYCGRKAILQDSHYLLSKQIRIMCAEVDVVWKSQSLLHVDVHISGLGWRKIRYRPGVEQGCT